MFSIFYFSFEYRRIEMGRKEIFKVALEAQIGLHKSTRVSFRLESMSVSFYQGTELRIDVEKHQHVSVYAYDSDVYSETLDKHRRKYAWYYSNSSVQR